MALTSDLTLSPASSETVLSRAWWAVVARFLTHGLIVSAWVSRIPEIQTALHLSNAALGFALLGTAIGSIVAVPVTGMLVGRYGSKKTTTWSTIGFCLALLAPAFAFNAWSLFLALALYGAMAGANDVSINSQAVAVENAMTTPTMSRFHSMFSIGGMVGASIGGLIAAHEIMPPVHFAIVSAALLVTSVLTGPHLLDADDHIQERKERLRFTRVPTVLITLALIGFCMFLAEGAMADWVAVYLKQALAAKAGMAAAGYAVFSVGMAIFRFLGDIVTKHLGPTLTVRTGALVAAVGLTGSLLTHSPMLALVGFGLTGAGFSVIVPLAFGAGGRVRSLPKGAGVAMVSGSGYIGFLFGPPVIGVIAQWTSLRIALFTIVALCLLAAALARAVEPEKIES